MYGIYLPTFNIEINQMYVNIPYMHDMGLEKQNYMESENPPEIKHHGPTPNHLSSSWNKWTKRSHDGSMGTGIFIHKDGWIFKYKNNQSHGSIRF